MTATSCRGGPARAPASSVPSSARSAIPAARVERIGERDVTLPPGGKTGNASRHSRNRLPPLSRQRARPGAPPFLHSIIDEFPRRRATRKRSAMKEPLMLILGYGAQCLFAGREFVDYRMKER